MQLVDKSISVHLRDLRETPSRHPESPGARHAGGRAVQDLSEYLRDLREILE